MLHKYIRSGQGDTREGDELLKLKDKSNGDKSGRDQWRLEMRGRFLTIRGRRFWNNIQQEHCGGGGDNLTRIETELDKFMDGII